MATNASQWSEELQGSTRTLFLSGAQMKNSCPAILLLASVSTGWNDVLLEQHRLPSSEPADVMTKQDVIVVTLGHSSTWEFKKERRFGASSRRERDFLLSKPLAFFWSAESREGRVYERSLSGCRYNKRDQTLG